MKSDPQLILPDHCTPYIFKAQTAMSACNYYLYRAGCPYRKKLIHPHKHAADTDIQKISLNTSSSEL